jgi:hypothetical protein
MIQGRALAPALFDRMRVVFQQPNLLHRQLLTPCTIRTIDTRPPILNNEYNIRFQPTEASLMADESTPEITMHTMESTRGKWILLGVAILYVVGSLYFLFSLNSRLDKLSKDQDAKVMELTKRMQSAEAEAETLGRQVGLTKKELASRAAELQRQQRAAEARLAEEQRQQITAVTGEVAGVKTDVTGVRTDVEATKADLEATKGKLQSAIGDLGMQSGLIATTRADLEILKHKGDRNYFEFTLVKGAKPLPVSTISLQLKKADQKRGKFTLNVGADDKTIEKKDRNIAEPIQFYTGRDHLLYELVIWTVEKNRAAGYLSTPKNAPVPVATN